MVLAFAGIPAIGAAVVAWASVLASQGKLDIVVVLAVALAGAEVGGLAGYAIGARSQPDASCSWPGTTVSARPAERQAPASERPAGNHGDCLVDAADLARRFGLGGAARVSDGPVARSVHDRAAGEVDLARGDRAGPVGRGEGGDVGDLVVAGQVTGQQARGTERARGFGLAGARAVLPLVVFVVSGRAWREQPAHPHAVWPELGRELAAEPGERGPGDVGAAEPRDRFPSAGHDEDDAVAAAGHVPAYGGGDVEVRSNRFSDRPHELLRLHREQWRALDVVVGDGVETDVDAAAGSGIGVPRDRRSVEDVDLRDMCGT